MNYTILNRLYLTLSFSFCLLGFSPLYARSTGDLVDTASHQGSLNTWTQLAQEAGLEKTLRGKGPYTLFAPSDEAFSRIHPDSLAMLRRPENKQALASLLSYHIVPGRVMIGDLKSMPYPTRINATIAIVKSGGNVMVNQSHVTQSDIVTANGVIHIIDDPLFPPGVIATTETTKSVNGVPEKQQTEIKDFQIIITPPKTSVTR
jgi:uncharacterized surface protein with fasciclin (FAS1) repeats